MYSYAAARSRSGRWVLEPLRTSAAGSAAAEPSTSPDAASLAVRELLATLVPPLVRLLDCVAVVADARAHAVDCASGDVDAAGLCRVAVRGEHLAQMCAILQDALAWEAEFVWGAEGLPALSPAWLPAAPDAAGAGVPVAALRPPPPLHAAGAVLAAVAGGLLATRGRREGLSARGWVAGAGVALACAAAAAATAALAIAADTPPATGDAPAPPRRAAATATRLAAALALRLPHPAFIPDGGAAARARACADTLAGFIAATPSPSGGGPRPRSDPHLGEALLQRAFVATADLVGLWVLHLGTARSEALERGCGSWHGGRGGDKDCATALAALTRVQRRAWAMLQQHDVLSPPSTKAAPFVDDDPRMTASMFWSAETALAADVIACDLAALTTSARRGGAQPPAWTTSAIVVTASHAASCALVGGGPGVVHWVPAERWSRVAPVADAEEDVARKGPAAAAVAGVTPPAPSPGGSMPVRVRSPFEWAGA
jgi:hypothetical protein